MGTVTFVMGLFYLVNNKDSDIKRYSWNVIGMTISIFSAVLIFQALQSPLENLILANQTLEVRLVAKFVVFIVWFLCSQIVVLTVVQFESLHGEVQLPARGGYTAISTSSDAAVDFRAAGCRFHSQNGLLKGSSSRMILIAKC